MTKEEFKTRWESDETGGGITFDDVADCAKEWGLYRTPKIHDMQEVLNRVLEAANVEDNPPKEERKTTKMGIKTLILGQSGTGKSASLRNFKEDEVAVINCASKPLPFKNHFEQHNPRFDHLTDDVMKAIATTKKKVIVIDDAQYIMSFQYMRRIHENGWDKWNDIQGDFFNIIQYCDLTPDDTTVYFLSHITKDDDGNEKIKTMGKMLDEKITIEGLFTTVLKTSVQDGHYYFLTQNSGKDTVKSPIGMFDSYAIDNDLKYVDEKIRNYYEIGDYKPDEEMKQLDTEKAAPEVEKPEEKKRRRGRPRKEERNEEKEEQQKKPEETLTEETPAEKPKRRRKQRESVADPAESVANEAESVADTDKQAETKAMYEKHKRRRKKRMTKEEAEEIMNVPEGVDEELPFN